MPKILTVDDSRAIRMIVTKQLTEMGFEVGESEDGNEGLKKLEGESFDLVLLDVTMPNLDGPGMLAKLRQTGNKTPVVMLTSESKTSIVASLMKLGIDDYILKPFKADELKKKVLKALKLPENTVSVKSADGGGASVPTPAAAPPEARQQGASVSGTKVEVLVVDDIENVHKKLRTLLPQVVNFDGCLNAQEALALCRVRKYRVILADNDLPGTTAASFVGQLRVLQPEAIILAMALRSANNLLKEVREQGFDDLFPKPFTAESVDSLVEEHFASVQNLVNATENLIELGAFHGREDRLEKHFQRLGTLIKPAINGAAEACYEDLIINLSLLPVDQPARAAQFVMEVVENAGKLGLRPWFVTSKEVKKVLGGFEETQKLNTCETIEEARSRVAA